jgi:predicted extracellular nuclease
MSTTYGTAGRRGSPGLVNPACPLASCPAATHLVINELDYDMTGSDTTEFVEIFNPTSAALDLTGFALVFVNGSTDTEAGRATLSGTLAPGAYLIVQTASSASLVVPSGVATATLSSSLQNDDEAVVLLGPDGVVDCVAYEGTVPTATIGGVLLTLTECGTSAGTESAAGSLARRPNACDRDTPAMDWAVAASPSVGVANP